jgi:hypothetical protein
MIDQKEVEEFKAKLEMMGYSITEVSIIINMLHGILDTHTAHLVEREKQRIWGEICSLADDYTGELISHLDDIDKIIRKKNDQATVIHR